MSDTCVRGGKAEGVLRRGSIQFPGEVVQMSIPGLGCTNQGATGGMKCYNEKETEGLDLQTRSQNVRPRASGDVRATREGTGRLLTKARLSKS